MREQEREITVDRDVPEIPGIQAQVFDNKLFYRSVRVYTPMTQQKSLSLSLGKTM